MQMEQVKLNAFIFLINMSILKNNIFIYLAVPGLSCGMWDLVPWLEIKPEPLWVQSLRLDHQWKLLDFFKKQA